MDWVIVLDESGSITDSSWLSAKNFTTTLINSFVVSDDAANMGLVFFSTVSRVISNLTDNSTALLRSMNQAQQAKEFTCIGCGLQTGVTVLQREGTSSSFSSLGSPIPRLLLIVTDGQNNRPLGTYDTVLNQSIAAAQQEGVFVIAVGVGSQVDNNELNRMASTYQGVKQVFYTDSYVTLPSLIEQLVAVSCTTLNPIPCGDQCHGFCGCEKQCLCPQCPTTDACHQSSCTNSSGCLITPVECHTSNPCLVASCDPMIGCQYNPIECQTDNQCLVASCDPVTGCQYDPVTCQTDNQCLVASCDPVIGCQYNPVTCQTNNSCLMSSCDPGAGCQYDPVTCQTSNQCLVASCDPSTGCQYKPVNCDDGDPTTIDTCDPQKGCQHQSDTCGSSAQVIQIDLNVNLICSQTCSG
jgi:hypothetical protein